MQTKHELFLRKEVLRNAEKIMSLLIKDLFERTQLVLHIHAIQKLLDRMYFSSLAELARVLEEFTIIGDSDEIQQFLLESVALFCQAVALERESIGVEAKTKIIDDLKKTLSPIKRKDRVINKIKAIREEEYALFDRVQRIWEEKEGVLHANKKGEEFITLLESNRVTSSLHEKKLKPLSLFVERHGELLRKDIEERLFVYTASYMEIEAPFQEVIDVLEDAVQLFKGKQQIIFRSYGNAILLNRCFVEQLKMILLELVRNSIIHGIEDDFIREKKGKPSIGSIEVTLEEKAQELVIFVKDDGKGMDLERVLSSSMLVENGVGLDLASNFAKKRAGSLIIDSESEKGCLITITVPKVLFFIEAVICMLNHQCYGVPTSLLMSIEGEVLILCSGEKIRVDKILDQQTLYVQQLPKEIVQKEHIIGVSIFGNDQVILIIQRGPL